MTADTQKIRAELETRRTELLARQERVAKHTRHREEPLPADFAEQAVELENGETLVALDQEIGDEIARIGKALQRIEADTYSECEGCGEPIGLARLKALPDTPLCIDCANAADSR
jgi:DnaK suppressor protein